MILFAGDPHGKFTPIIRAAQVLRPEGVVLLGDYDLTQPLECALANLPSSTQTWWIPGNHDADQVVWYDNLFGSAMADQNLHGRVVGIADLKIAGLGGVFRGEIWHPDTGVKWATRNDYLRHTDPSTRWRGDLPRKHRVSIWWEDFEHLANQQADVLVTHEAPSCHPHGYEVIDELASMMGAKLIVHGHHHEDYTEELSNGIRVLGVGLAGVTSDRGVVVSPGLTSTHKR